MTITGGCQCGAVRYRIESEPLVARTCWCRFCPVCGTHVYIQSEMRPHFFTVRAGTLDDPEIGKPSITIWTSMAPSWAAIDPRIPHHEQQPPPPSPSK